MSDSTNTESEFAFCWKCGEKIANNVEFCPKCGAKQKRDATSEQTPVDPNASPKSRLVACLLCFFLGAVGAHRFYVGKIGSGIAMILLDWLTCGIWGIVDLIMICCGKFTDSEGKLITNWDC